MEFYNLTIKKKDDIIIYYGYIFDQIKFKYKIL